VVRTFSAWRRWWCTVCALLGIFAVLLVGGCGIGSAVFGADAPAHDSLPEPCSLVGASTIDGVVGPAFGEPDYVYLSSLDSEVLDPHVSCEWRFEVDEWPAEKLRAASRYLKVEALLADDAEAACADASGRGKRVRHGPGTAAYLQLDHGNIGYTEESSALQFCQGRDVVTVVFGGNNDEPHAGGDSVPMPQVEAEQGLLRVAREVSDRLVNARRIDETPRPAQPAESPMDVKGVDARGLATPDFLRTLIGETDDPVWTREADLNERVATSECSWSPDGASLPMSSGRHGYRFLQVQAQVFSSKDGHTAEARADLETRHWMRTWDAEPFRGLGDRAGFAPSTFRTDAGMVGFTWRNVSVVVDVLGRDHIDGHLGEIAPPAEELERQAREAAATVAGQLKRQMDG
jgi:hypothetical protein